MATIEDLERQLGSLEARTETRMASLEGRVSSLETIQPRSRLKQAWEWIRAAVSKAWPPLKAAGPWVLVAVMLLQNGGVFKGCDWKPDPNPDPTPVPPPPPPPDPPPIPVAGLRVLIVYESAEKKTWSLPKSVADYLNAKCVKAGNQPEWRLLDKDTPMGGESKIWQDAMARKRDTIPWVVISDGKTGYEGPWPVDHVEDQLALLRKYGGQ